MTAITQTQYQGVNTCPILSDIELELIEGRAAAATPGPWKSYVEGRDHTSGSSFIMTGPADNRGEDIELTGASIADQDFMAAARSDIPRLIAEIRRLQALCVGLDVQK